MDNAWDACMVRACTSPAEAGAFQASFAMGKLGLWDTVTILEQYHT